MTHYTVQLNNVIPELATVSLERCFVIIMYSMALLLVAKLHVIVKPRVIYLHVWLQMKKYCRSSCLLVA